MGMRASVGLAWVGGVGGIKRTAWWGGGIHGDAGSCGAGLGGWHWGHQTHCLVGREAFMAIQDESVRCRKGSTEVRSPG
jgi:hypothetical protein